MSSQKSLGLMKKNVKATYWLKRSFDWVVYFFLMLLGLVEENTDEADMRFSEMKNRNVRSSLPRPSWLVLITYILS